MASFNVYRNLHKRTLSVVHKNKVVKHDDRLMAINCTLVVQPSGHARTVSEGKKYVHAFIRSNDEPVHDVLGELLTDDMRELKYNPYRAAYFHDGETGKRIDNALVVIADGVTGKMFYK